ncbi:polysaccharide biosynthesis protein [Nocardioides hungaricus]
MTTSVEPSSPTFSGTVLVTGGTGSFGTTMVRRLLGSTSVERVRVLSRDEAKQDQMRRQLGDSRLRFYLGDVRDRDSVVDAMRDVNYVFHAAALKQVPSCEFFPLQAVQTNVQGSENVITAAERSGVQSVVCLSTDKAVYPINAMGLSKALMEKVAMAHARNNPRSRTTVSVTRYGNVMMSRGSVIPVFMHQALSGQPLTVTQPDMTRFIMSLEESVQLVEHAFAHATPGDLFVRKAPATTILDLAHAVAEVCGKYDAEIRVLGTRHGEKLYETLLSREEVLQAQELGDYFRVPLDARSLEYELFFDGSSEVQTQQSDYTSHNTTRLTKPEVKAVLWGLPAVRAELRRAGVDVPAAAGSES